MALPSGPRGLLGEALDCVSLHLESLLTISFQRQMIE